MKILMFGWEFPPHNSGGLGVACLGLTRALAAQNIDITFVLPQPVDVQAPFIKIVFAQPNVKIKPVDSLLIPYTTSKNYLSRRLKASGIYGWDLLEEVGRYALAASKIALSEDFDIIHAHDWLSFEAGLEVKRISGKPLIVHVHATEFDRSGDNINQEIYEIEKEGMEQADGIIAVSNFTKEIIVRNYGISPDKIQVVWNGIEAEDIVPTQNQGLSAFKEAGFKIVLFVGRLTMQKGPDYFLLVAKKVLECFPKVIFVVAGSGDMENQVISQAASLGISDHILFTGFVRGQELNQLYKAADLYVLPSVSEPFGITSLESLINGTPVLISKQSGAAEALSHTLKADFWDIEEMADKILSVINHSSLADCLKENGQNEVKKLTWKNAAQKCLNIYNKFFIKKGKK